MFVGCVRSVGICGACRSLCGICGGFEGSVGICGVLGTCENLWEVSSPSFSGHSAMSLPQDPESQALSLWGSMNVSPSFSLCPCLRVTCSYLPPCLRSTCLPGSCPVTSFSREHPRHSVCFLEGSPLHPHSLNLCGQPSRTRGVPAARPQEGRKTAATAKKKWGTHPPWGTPSRGWKL